MDAARYEIVVRGRLGGAVSRWFDELEVQSSDAGTTHLCGWFPDQPALHAALGRLADLGLEILELRRLPGPQ